eukprot:gene16381-18691_t
MSISSDEVNFLIFRYLSENGFSHSAFTFAHESLVVKSSTAQTEIPPGALITFLQKGLEYIAIEEHINEDGSIQEYDNNFSLLSPLICEAIAVKEDRRSRRTVPQTGASAAAGAAAGNNASSGAESMDVTNDATSAAAEGAEGSSGTGVSSTAASTHQLVTEETGARYLQLNGHQGEVFMCLWNPQLKQLATGSADGMCRLWNLSTMDAEKWASNDTDIPLKTAIMPHTQSEGEKFKDVTSVTWSPDGQFLATGCYDGVARIWDNSCYDGVARIWDNSGNLVTYLREHTGPVFSLKWSKSGKYILSGSYDRRAIVWNASSGVIVKVFSLHAGPVLDVDWRDSDSFATCSSDRSIYICQVSSQEENTPLRCLSGHDDEVNAVCWSPGGELLASCSDDSTAKIWTAEEGLKYDLRGHLKEIFTLRWTPTGPSSQNPDKPLLLCTASFDGTVKVWSGETGVLVYNLCKQVQPVYSLAPSPDGEFIATGSLGGNVSIWSLRKGDCLREIQGTGDTFDVSWSADGSLLCSCFSSGMLCVVDTTGSTAGPSITTKALTDSPATTSASAAASAASPSQESKTQEPEGAEGPSEESAVVAEEDAAVEMDSSE